MSLLPRDVGHFLDLSRNEALALGAKGPMTTLSSLKSSHPAPPVLCLHIHCKQESQIVFLLFMSFLHSPT